jgi:hypothetical protein
MERTAMARERRSLNVHCGNLEEMLFFIQNTERKSCVKKSHEKNYAKEYAPDSPLIINHTVRNFSKELDTGTQSFRFLVLPLLDKSTRAGDLRARLEIMR